MFNYMELDGRVVTLRVEELEDRNSEVKAKYTKVTAVDNDGVEYLLLVEEVIKDD